MTDLAKVNTFISWLKEKGGHFHESAEVKIDPETGLSPFSTASIGADERLVSCPFDLAITSELASRTIIEVAQLTEEELVWPAGTSKEGEKWNERMRIAAYLGFHWSYSAKPETMPNALAHLPYLESLPHSSSLTTPLYYTADELELLKGSSLYGAVEARKAEWRAESDAIRHVLKEEGLSWERYLASATYISSRSFPSKLLRIPADGSITHEAEKDEGSQPVLLPGLDLFNHSRGQPILWLSSQTSTSTGHTTPSISLVSTQITEKGVQLYNNYGPKSNEELLLGYGFVIPDNPDDVVTLRLGTAQLPPPIIAKLEAKKLDSSRVFELRRDGEVDKSLLEMMRIMLNEHDCHNHDEIDEEDEHALHQHEEQELQLKLDVLGMLGGMLDDKLDKLQSSVSEVAEEGKIRGEIKRMCEIYKQGQIDILNATMDKLSERIERIEGLLDEGMGGCPCGC
ncbi:uncharacterized protein I303_100928 [Kwoniella dejecticola CBS 10117]|uniref:Uncharacterized protein n=1 Tax=Kwoniella dejecticola CBS 10117 TaxID=1296121 RepID=A0A1A6AGA4_9TREE|nr:uncharacterized protein I303_00932 [Kwoniella dejecticola CBS 10117]OBR89110.1 hypothetical protein I303_00932 [Kwoniella dejecticola CBS 10117]